MDNSEARKRKEEAGVRELTITEALDMVEKSLIGAASMLRQIIETAPNRD